MFSLVLTKIKTSTNISEKKLVKSHPKIYAVSFYPSVNSARSSSVTPPSPRLCNEYPSQVIYCGKDGLFYKTYPNTVDSPYKESATTYVSNSQSSILGTTKPRAHQTKSPLMDPKTQFCYEKTHCDLFIYQTIAISHPYLPTQ